MDLLLELCQLRLHQTHLIGRVMLAVWIRLRKLFWRERLHQMREGLLHERLCLRYLRVHVLYVRGDQQYLQVLSMFWGHIPGFKYCFLQELRLGGCDLFQCDGYFFLPEWVPTDLEFNVLPRLPLQLPELSVFVLGLHCLQYGILPQCLQLLRLHPSQLLSMFSLFLFSVLSGLQFWQLRFWGTVLFLFL
jgi:hypothetical protein